MSDYTIRPPKGAKKNKRIVGRGASGRRGVTAGRGDKGQNSRSGGGVKPGFEGGQMPLYRRVATKGFNNARFTSRYDVVNVSDIAKRFENGAVVDRVSLIEKRLIRRSSRLVKVLGDGEIDVKITLHVDAVSASARSKIEKAGGTVGDVASDDGKAASTKATDAAVDEPESDDTDKVESDG